jgi:single stranded DNA-binding protein
MFENFETIGRLTRDIEIKIMENGASFYTGSIAVNKTKDKVVFHNFTLDKKYGDKIGKYLLKGTQVFITGIPSLNVWINKSNEPQGNIKISVNKLVFLGNKEQNIQNDTVEQTNTTPSIDYDIPF